LNGKKNKLTLKERKQKFLKEFPNFAIARPCENIKRMPLVAACHKDPYQFFSCN
jgi:hypothetical protein